MNKEKSVRKGGRINKSVLAIICAFIVLLIALGGFIYFSGKTSKNIYLRTIDEFASALTKTINKTDISKLQHVDYNIAFNLNSSNKEYASIAKLVNKIKLNASVESDYKNKKANMNYDVFYNNSSVIKANLYLNENNAYVDLPSLYDKLVKVPTDDIFDLNEIWNMYNKDNFKTVVNEFTKILKNNLNDEYFTNADEKITVLGKEVSVTKQVLTLTGKDMYNLKTSVLNDVLNNKKLLNSLSSIANITVDDLKEQLNTTKSAITEEDATFNAEIYTNKSTREIEHAIVKYNDEIISLDKTNADIFDIIVDNNKVGSLTVKNEKVNLTVDYKDIKLNFDYEKDALALSTEAEGMVITIKANGNEEKGNCELKINIPSEKLDLTVTVDYEIKSIKNIQNRDFTNYIELDSMTEEDMNSIMTKLYENEALLTLIEDISNITGNLFATELY